jgi:recombinational DNA repair protein (RecF pathway)
VPHPTLSTDAWILGRRPATDRFQPLTVFSADRGRLSLFHRLSRKADIPNLDLFDEVALTAESSNQGQSWFIRDVRLLRRFPEIGRDYDRLLHASTFATLVARNEVVAESRAAVYRLLGDAFAAFASDAPPAVVRLKATYRLARDEGYPVAQHWFPTLPSELRQAADRLLHRPLAELDPSDTLRTERLLSRLHEYLQGHTDLLVD